MHLNVTWKYCVSGFLVTQQYLPTKTESSWFFCLFRTLFSYFILYIFSYFNLKIVYYNGRQNISYAVIHPWPVHTSPESTSNIFIMNHVWLNQYQCLWSWKDDSAGKSSCSNSRGGGSQLPITPAAENVCPILPSSSPCAHVAHTHTDTYTQVKIQINLFKNTPWLYSYYKNATYR